MDGGSYGGSECAPPPEEVPEPGVQRRPRRQVHRLPPAPFRAAFRTSAGGEVEGFAHAPGAFA